jgi:hypothetical protein
LAVDQCGIDRDSDSQGGEQPDILRNTRTLMSENDVDTLPASAAWPMALRAALHAALEGTRNLLASHGIFNMSASEHAGLDQRARVMVRIVGSKSRLAVD